MTVLCIIISVFLVTAIFSVADMMIRTESDFMISNHGNWHIAIKNISQNNADEISNRSDVTAVGVASQFNFEGEQPYRVNEKRTVLYGTDEVYITQISNGIVEGTFPANDEEVMLTPNSVTALGVQLGDSVTLHTPAGDRTFTISGFGTDDESYILNSHHCLGNYAYDHKSPPLFFHIALPLLIKHVPLLKLLSLGAPKLYTQLLAEADGLYPESHPLILLPDEAKKDLFPICFHPVLLKILSDFFPHHPIPVHVIQLTLFSSYSKPLKYIYSPNPMNRSCYLPS